MKKKNLQFNLLSKNKQYVYHLHKDTKLIKIFRLMKLKEKEFSQYNFDKIF